MLTVEEALVYADKWGARNRYECARELIELQGKACLDGIKEATEAALQGIRKASYG